MTTRFTWAQRIPGNAQACGEELSRLQEQHGTITPRLVVQAARADESPLHRCFEWNDDIAAERYREDRARHVIRAIRVEHIENGQRHEPIRVFVNLDGPEDEGRSYLPLARVLGDKELFERARQQFLRDADSFKKRYQEFKALASLVDQMKAQAESVTAA